MIGKFASARALTPLILMSLLFLFVDARAFGQPTSGAQTPAQAQAGQSPAAATPTAQAPTAQTPTAQTPAAQKPDAGQEPADEESVSRRKKPRNFRNWDFNVGAGANTDSGTTHNFVRGGGFVGSVGAARNANQYLGLRADFIFADLPLRDSTQELAQATGATSYAYSITLDPIINVPVTKHYGGYVLFGGSFIHRAGSLQDDTTVPGSGCSPFWTWWGSCTNGSVPLSGNFVDSSINQFGYNFGAGATRKMPSGVEIYAEYRFMHGSHAGITTDFRPITIGLRW